MARIIVRNVAKEQKILENNRVLLRFLITLIIVKKMRKLFVKGNHP